MAEIRPPRIDDPPVTATGREPVPDLVRGLVHDLSRLFSQEVALAKQEISEAVGNAQAGVISIGIGAGALFAGLLFLLLSAVYGLSRVVEPWLAALIVGGVMMLVGLVLVMRARSKLSVEALMPDRTIRSLRKDEQLVKRTAT